MHKTAKAALWATCAALTLGNTPALSPKPASPATIAAQKAAAAALPAEDGRDADFAGRGFVTTRTEPLIKAADGRPVWNLAGYEFVGGASPDSVNPSLWRHIGLLRKHGLFKVTEGVWQVRGFDVSNMTVVAGRTGWIVIDPLTTRETAAAAMELITAQLGQRPISAVIYSHSHVDHFGGVRGVVSDAAAGKVAILAPAGFTEEAASENIMAGAAMGRRANYQFGVGLTPGPLGQIGSGIGTGVSGGETTLIAPTGTIARTGDKRSIDGVDLEFQIVSGSEAPSELNVYLVPQKVFLSAEMSTCSLHNILTPRGAKVRDARAWAGYLDEALTLYGARSEAMISSHCWPRFGAGEVAGSLAAQRDNYRYLHDQTVRRMNQGQTMVELAEGLTQPPEIAAQWFNHGYYGTYSHNSKAIYQFYLGWYDANPANLNPHPPVERATRLVAAMGGANKVLREARRAMATGDYRWSSDLLSQMVFAEPHNAQGRALLADSFEQQGYQAESGIWRNQFLVAAQELRNGNPKRGASTQSADLITAIPTQLLFDSVATRYAPERLGRAPFALDLVIADRNERVGVEIGKSVLIARTGTPAANPVATLTAPRRLFLALFFLKIPLAQLQAMGLKVEGDAAAVAALQDALDPIPGGFNIAEP